MNWGGSSKGMEPNLAVEMLNTVKDDNFAVTTLIGDDDTTTMAILYNADAISILIG